MNNERYKVWAFWDALMGVAKSSICTGSVNLLNPTLSTATVAGLTMTLQSDGTYLLSGTPTGAGSKPNMFSMSSLQCLVGQYVTLSGGTPEVRLQVYSSRTSSVVLYRDSGRGVTFLLTQELVDSGDVRIAWPSTTAGTDVTGTVIKPMITAYGVSDLMEGKFYSYVPSNKELYDMIKTYHPEVANRATVMRHFVDEEIIPEETTEETTETKKK